MIETTSLTTSRTENIPEGIIASDTPEAYYNEDPVAMYLHDIGNKPLLTGAEEVKLAQAIELGIEPMSKLVNDGLRSAFGLSSVFGLEEKDISLIEGAIEARQIFIESNLRLVVSIATKYQNRGLELIDLISEGNLGLEHAVEKFDWTKGFKFSTYATWWIRQAVARAIFNKGTVIRVPVHVHERSRQYYKARDKLKHQNVAPTSERIAEEIGISVKEVQKITETRNVLEPVSLDEPIPGGNNSGLYKMESSREDFVADSRAEGEYEDVGNQEIVSNIRPMLLDIFADNLEMYEIIVLRFGLDGEGSRTLNEAAELLGISRGTVANRQRTAMTILRDPRRNKHHDYLKAFFS